jgi:hypothetical protein
MESTKLIPRYDGSGDIEAWLCRSEIIVQTKKENPADVIPVCLDGAAFAVYEHLSSKDRADFAAIRVALTRAFGMSEYDAFAAFSERKLQVGESTDVFAIAITRLGRQCAITEDTALACKFVSGLPLAMRKEVMVKMGRRPTLADATAIAQLLLSDSRRTIDGFIGHTSTSEQATHQCVKCGKANHVAAECRARTCFNCGKLGHIARMCTTPSMSGNDKGKIASLPLDNLPNRHQ